MICEAGWLYACVRGAADKYNLMGFPLPSIMQSFGSRPPATLSSPRYASKRFVVPIYVRDVSPLLQEVFRPVQTLDFEVGFPERFRYVVAFLLDFRHIHSAQDSDFCKRASGGYIAGGIGKSP